MIEKDIVLYLEYINRIGGVESWIYYIVKKYSKNHNICVLYKAGSLEQVCRLLEYCEVVKIDDDTKIKCNTFICGYSIGILDNVDAKKVYQFQHCDFRFNPYAKPNNHDKITKKYGVSNLVCDGYEELTGEKIDVCYNPIVLDEPKHVLKLISPTRLSPDKGDIWYRMETFARWLKKCDVPFIWLVFSNDEIKTDIDEIKFMKPNLDILPFINDSDYLVQFSDSEGYAYSIVESLGLGVPVLVTNFKVIKEIGVEDGVNGYVFNFNDFHDSDFDFHDRIDNVYNHRLRGSFKYECKQSDDVWNEILGEEVNVDYKKEEYNIVCEATSSWRLLDVDKIYKKNGYQPLTRTCNDFSYIDIKDGDILELDVDYGFDLIRKKRVKEISLVRR